MRGRDERVCGNLVLFFAILFSLALVTVHLTEPEVNFDAISLYSLGPFGLIMRIGFMSLGLAFVSTTLSLWDRTRHGSLYYLAEVLFLVSGIGLALIGIFNTDSPNSSPTLSGIVHSWSALTWSVSASLGIFVFAPPFVNTV